MALTPKTNALIVLRKVIQNITNNPEETKYRSIKIKKLTEKWGSSADFIVTCLEMIGFKRTKDEKLYLELDNDSEKTDDTIKKLKNIENNIELALNDKAMANNGVHLGRSRQKSSNIKQCNINIMNLICDDVNLNMEEAINLFVPQSDIETLAPLINESVINNDFTKLKDVIRKQYADAWLFNQINSQDERKSVAQSCSENRLDANSRARRWYALITAVLPQGDAQLVAGQIIGNLHGVNGKSDEEIRHDLNQYKLKLQHESLVEYNKNKQILRRLLQNESNWQCFVCGSRSNKKEDNECASCNKSFNPLLFAKINQSETFNVEKSFGLCKVEDLRNQNNHLNWPFNGLCIPLRIIVVFSRKENYTNDRYNMIEIRSLRRFNDGKTRLCIKDLKMIIQELFIAWYNRHTVGRDGSMPLTANVWFSSKHQFRRLADISAIPTKFNPQNVSRPDPYILNFSQDFFVDGVQIQDRFQISHTRKCEYLQLLTRIKDEMDECKTGDMDINIDHCPIASRCHDILNHTQLMSEDKTPLKSTASQEVAFAVEDSGQKLDKSDKFDVSEKEAKFISDHISHCDHYVSFGLKQNSCPCINKCSSIVNIENGMQTTQDLLHICLYKHNLINLKGIKSIKNIKNIKTRHEISSGSHGIFEYHKHWMEAMPISVSGPTRFNPAKGRHVSLYALVEEMINNGVEDQLEPIPNAETQTFDFNFENFAAFDPCEIRSSELCRHYKIFELIDDKMSHATHEKMNKVLKIREMLALKLYTDCDCNYDLTLTLREDEARTGYASAATNKWPIFDACLTAAIVKLSMWQSEDLWIYSGMCNIRLESEMKRNDDGCIIFKTYQSFSTDFQVAKEFAGDSGLIIALRLYQNQTRNIFFDCCGVSWVSNYKSENEILVRKASIIFPIHTIDIGSHQIVICSCDPLEDSTLLTSSLYDFISS